MRSTQSQMMTIAKDLGLNFEKMQERLTCNTLDAHRLVKWAGDQGQQTGMKQTLFEAYFGGADDVTDRDILVKCAGFGLVRPYCAGRRSDESEGGCHDSAGVHCKRQVTHLRSPGTRCLGADMAGDRL